MSFSVVRRSEVTLNPITLIKITQQVATEVLLTFDAPVGRWVDLGAEERIQLLPVLLCHLS